MVKIHVVRKEAVRMLGVLRSKNTGSSGGCGSHAAAGGGAFGNLSDDVCQI